ncbi:MAG TPA: amidohydrolase [Candidatus Binatia bacterium]|nr:amidohydrolase [Candidatus Binatia bacterium]
MNKAIWVLLLMLASACGGHEADFARSLAVKAPAEIVLHRGKIVTADRDFSIHQAVAVKDGRFLAVGSERDIRPLIGPTTRVIDLAGRTVIPGLIDSHIYATVAGLTWDNEIRWEMTRTLADGLRQIGAAAKAKPRGSWIVVGGGWVPTQFAERRFPTLAELDAAAPNHPVFVQYLREGALLNSAGLAAAGIARGTPDPSGGKFQRNPKTMELTGWLQGAALHYVYNKMPRPALNEARQGLENCFRELNRVGITSISDLQTSGITFAHRRVLAGMARSGELTVRMNIYVAADERSGKQLEQTLAEIKTLNQSDYFRFAGFFDGATGEALSNGSLRAQQAKEDFQQKIKFFAQGGRNLHLYTGSDSGARQLLDVLEAAHPATPFNRIVFAGLDDPTPETIERLKRLGGGLAVLDRMALTGERNVELWGLEKARNAPPLRAMAQAELPMGAGTGAFQGSSYSPMLALSWLVTGKTVAGSVIRSPSQNLTRAEALRLYTTGSAWLTFEEGRKGSIEVGKFADLAVLNADYLTVPEEQIRSLQSLLTMVGGRVVYAAAPFEQAERIKRQRK